MSIWLLLLLFLSAFLFSLACFCFGYSRGVKYARERVESNLKPEPTAPPEDPAVVVARAEEERRLKLEKDFVSHFGFEPAQLDDRRFLNAALKKLQGYYTEAESIVENAAESPIQIPPNSIGNGTYLDRYKIACKKFLNARSSLEVFYPDLRGYIPTPKKAGVVLLQILKLPTISAEELQKAFPQKVGDESIFCSKCNTPHSSKAKFCPTCGAQLTIS